MRVSVQPSPLHSHLPTDSVQFVHSLQLSLLGAQVEQISNQISALVGFEPLPFRLLAVLVQLSNHYTTQPLPHQTTTLPNHYTPNHYTTQSLHHPTSTLPNHNATQSLHHT